LRTIFFYLFRDICPTDTFIIGFLAFGEGWHNYHHVYPWDYKVSELPKYYCNFTIPFIDFFAWLGWATDLKTVSEEMIKKRVLRTGDGTHRFAEQDGKNETDISRDVDHFWGFDDKDMLDEDKESVQILYPKFDCKSL
jgi:stearoyl-CoA desaturase (Delta-9 desaturase)